MADTRAALVEDAAYEIAHWIALEARVAEAADRSCVPVVAEGAKRIAALARSAPEERGEGALRCEKCNSRDIYTRYRKKGEFIDGGYPDYERAREDCLRRYCRTCGDKWTDPLA